jgi:hypothetical protein
MVLPFFVGAPFLAPRDWPQGDGFSPKVFIIYVSASVWKRDVDFEEK